MNRLYLLLLLLLLAISLPAFPQAFTYKAIDIPGAMETQVRGVNSSGEIVGFYKTTSCVDFNIQFPNCPVHGFKITNGVLTKLLVPHSTWTDIMGVNDFGDLVGFAITSDTGAHAFLWTHKNVITYFNTPEGGTNSDVHPVAMSVNKALIVGGSDWFFGNMAPNGGWVWANGKFGIMNPGDSSGGCCPDGEGVNGVSNNGFLSGQNVDQGHETAWFKSGHDEDFYPLDSDVVGTGVNNNADVIGFSVDGKGFFAKHIELNEGANDAVEVKPSFIPVSFPGAKATYPFGLSDKRMIGGTYVDSNGGVHAFIATPNF
jgi:hypothetical protein